MCQNKRNYIKNVRYADETDTGGVRRKSTDTNEYPARIECHNGTRGSRPIKNIRTSKKFIATYIGIEINT